MDRGQWRCSVVDADVVELLEVGELLVQDVHRRREAEEDAHLPRGRCERKGVNRGVSRGVSRRCEWVHYEEVWRCGGTMSRRHRATSNIMLKTMSTSGACEQRQGCEQTSGAWRGGRACERRAAQGVRGGVGGGVGGARVSVEEGRAIDGKM